MKIDIEKILVYKEFKIRRVLEILDCEGKAIAIAVDKNKKLLGTITDGDIRRALLRGISIEEPIEKIIHYNPIVARNSLTKEELKDIFIKNAIQQLLIVNEDGELVNLISINEILLHEGKENTVIIMAGGLGTRLKELTIEIPKPMLKIGQDPMLQHIINNFKKYGYNKILLSVNYKAEIIENYFQDGYAYGVKIEYIKEHKRLGTAGGIKLAKEYIDKPFFVMNGDIFTNLNVENMMEYHVEKGFDITVATRIHSFQVPYGVINTENNSIKELKEKPIVEYLINAGVYCLNPSLLEYIPEDEYFEITDLINLSIQKGLKIGNYEIKEYWMDIGKLEDYNKVNKDVYDLLCADKVGGA